MVRILVSEDIVYFYKVLTVPTEQSILNGHSGHGKLLGIPQYSSHQKRHA